MYVALKNTTQNNQVATNHGITKPITQHLTFVRNYGLGTSDKGYLTNSKLDAALQMIYMNTVCIMTLVADFKIVGQFSKMMAALINQLRHIMHLACPQMERLTCTFAAILVPSALYTTPKHTRHTLVPISVP